VDIINSSQIRRIPGRQGLMETRNHKLHPFFLGRREEARRGMKREGIR